MTIYTLQEHKIILWDKILYSLFSADLDTNYSQNVPIK